MNTVHTQPPITVIIPHYRQETQLAECLECLTRQDYTGNITVLVIDNDASFALGGWQERYPSVTFLWEPKPGSYSARNKGLEHARDEIIAFTDADCRPRPDWLREGITALLASPSTGLVGGRIMVTPYQPGRISICDAYEIACEFKQDFYINRLHFAATANMFTRRGMFDQMGRFNDTLRSSGDLAWGNKVYAKGHRLVYCDTAIVEHSARNYVQLKEKALRLAGGQRDLHPHKLRAVTFALRRILPSIHQLVWTVRCRDITWKAKAGAIAYQWFYCWQIAYYRLKVAFLEQDSVR